MSISTIRKSAVAFVALLGTTFAFAQNPNEEMVRGTITRIDFDDNRGTLTLRNSDTGATEQYTITPETELEVQTGSFATRARIDGIEDLQNGDQVRLNVRQETDNSYTVVSFSEDTEQAGVDDGTMTAQTTGRDEDDSYDTLPGTASNLPLVALAGALLLLIGAGLRVARTSKARK